MSDLEPFQEPLEWLRWVTELLDIHEIEGRRGLYFRAAEALAELTGSEHAVILLPTRPGILRAVGCKGFPTTTLGEVSVGPDDQGRIGIVGRAWRDRKVANVPDVSEDPDYRAYDAQVKSELAVPVFNRGHSSTEFLINLESHKLNYYERWHCEVIYELGNVILHCRDRLEQDSLIQERNGCLAGILNRIPDEVLVIDDQYRVVYANQAKREAFPRLGKYLELFESRHPGAPLSHTAGPPALEETCHWLIEGQSSPCAQCVCRKAMVSRAPVQECYKPHLNLLAELSAAPLMVGDRAVGAVETMRGITQREHVIDYSPELMEALNERQALQMVVNILHDRGKLGYARVRLYSILADQVHMVGVCCAGHERLTSDEFAQRKRPIPEALRPYLLKDSKAGLLVVGDEQRPEESLGYWRVHVTREELREMDPSGVLDLEALREAIIVPLVSQDRRWAVVLDSPKPFRHDDLQALAMLAKIASATLAVARRNELRFKMAVMGETGFGLPHAIEIPQRAYGPDRPIRSLHTVIEGLKARLSPGSPLHDTMDELTRLLRGEVKMPASGDAGISEWVDKMIRAVGPGGPTPNRITEIAQVSPNRQAMFDRWADLLREDDGWLDIVSALKSIVNSLTEQRLAWRQMEILIEGMRVKELFPNSEDNPYEPAVHNVLDILDFVYSIMLSKATHQRVKLEWTCPAEPIRVRFDSGPAFMAWLALLDNAIKAAKAAGDKAHVTVAVTSDGESLAVGISNNGDKLPEERYNTFGRDPWTSDESSGSGLGLVFAWDWINYTGGELVHRYVPPADKTNQWAGVTTFTTRWDNVVVAMKGMRND